ncbi:MAG: DUF3466 family protein [Candidatus Eremiobacteraeota bacterium]|nr:DUF3466 family protein [Candidatus Eremiobacteraeota bacterium]
MRIIGSAILRAATMLIGVGLVSTVPNLSWTRNGASYHLVDLGAPSPSVATAVNDRGQIVGRAFVSDLKDPEGRLIAKVGHAFEWSAGHFKTLGASPVQATPDYAISVAYSINQRGVVVGASGSFLPVSLSGLVFTDVFMYDNGALIEVPLFDVEEAMKPFSAGAPEQAFGINAHDTVVGSGSYRGFVYKRGKSYEIPPLSDLEEGNGTVGVAVNDSDVIVGATTAGIPSDRPRIHAFVWNDPGSSRMTDLGTLVGYQNSIAMAINSSGEIVGYASQGTTDRGIVGGKWIGNRDPDTLEFYLLPATGHAVAWRNGRTIDLGALPGSPQSAAYGVNDAGVIVGTSGGRAVAWIRNRIVDLNETVEAPSGWRLVEARGINNRGWIVGFGLLGGNQRAFLLVPN